MLIRRFMGMFRAKGTELLVANVGKDMRTAGVAARLCKIPVVHRVGLPGDMRNMFKVRELHRWIKPSILVPCEFIKDGLLDNLPYLDQKEITVIHTGKRPAAEPSEELRDPLHLIVTSQAQCGQGTRRPVAGPGPNCPAKATISVATSWARATRKANSGCWPTVWKYPTSWSGTVS